MDIPPNSLPDPSLARLSGMRRSIATPQEQRVARAICKSACGAYPEPARSQFVDLNWPNHVEHARAAIAAFPEPPKPPPVEGDEVFLFIGGERLKGHLLGIRKGPNARGWGDLVAWVEVFDAPTEIARFYSVPMRSLVRA